MSKDAEILQLMRELGLSEDNFRLLALLPLVQVAWADNAIQAAEKKTILEIAKGHELLNQTSQDKLVEWLSSKPDEAYFQKGRELLVKLAYRKKGIGEDIPEHVLENVVDLCEFVAESSGGLFNMFWTVSASERKAMEKIADHLSELADKENPTRGIVGRTMTMDWKTLMDEFGDQL